MSFFSIILIALALAMDALAVSVASGIILKKSKFRHALRIAFFFGLFQFFMPIIGSLAGLFIRDFISGVDHWFIFVLLTAIGGKMVYEAFTLKEEEERFDPTNLKTLIVLSVATSIDALAVGVSLSIMSGNILIAVSVIGVVTFILCLVGVLIGEFVGHFFEEKIEALGGLILIGIGIKILIEHIFFQGRP